MPSSSFACATLTRVDRNASGRAEQYALHKESSITIGRQSGCEIRFVSPAVSRKHAIVQSVEGDVVVIKNLSKLNPVTVNDNVVDIEGAVKLADGDVVGIQLSPDDEATFVFERASGEVAVRSPLKDNGQNTMNVTNALESSSPVKSGGSGKFLSSAVKSTSAAEASSGRDENREPAPESPRRTTPTRTGTLKCLAGTPMPAKNILNQVSALKMLESLEHRTSPERRVVDFSFREDQSSCGTPDGKKLQPPKSPGKSALKAPANRLALRLNTNRRRSISFANERELEAIKWIAPHNGRVELCGQIAPKALNTIHASSRERRSPSRSPVNFSAPSAKERESPAKLLALPAPSPIHSSSPKTRRTSISFKAVEDGEESETPDASFTRSGSQILRKDTPRASSRSRSAITSPDDSSASPVDSSQQFTPVASTEAGDDDINQTASTPSSLTPPESGTTKNLMFRMDFAAATPSSEFKRPRAPHNTPVDDVNARTPDGGFDFSGLDLFRTTPGALPLALAGVFDTDRRCDAILRAVQKLEADADADMTTADEIDGALAKLPSPASTKKRVQQWLSADLTLAEVPEDEPEDMDEVAADASVARLPSNSRTSLSPPKSIVVAMKKKSRRGVKHFGVSLRIEQLHRALKMTRVALVKERKRSEALKEMYLELMRTQNDRMVVASSHEEPKTPKVAMNVLIKEATPPPMKTPKVVLQLNIGEKMSAVASPRASPKPVFKSQVCAECEIEDKFKTVSCVTCQVVYHLKCCRPRLTRTPKEPWSCNSCSAAAVDATELTVSEKREREVVDIASDALQRTRSTRRRHN